MSGRIIIAFFALGFALAGCASPAQIGPMVGTPTIAVPANSILKQSVQVNSVGGGQETNPLWTSQVASADFQQALQQSLANQGLSGDANSRFRLDASLMELKQPFAGFDMTVTSTVHYIVTDRMANRTLLDQVVTASYTAKVGDAFVGVERLRLANQGSVKTNISQFLDKLIQSGSSGMMMSSLHLRPAG